MKVSKPCVICGRPLAARSPSELARKAAHKACCGTLVTLRAAARRGDRVMAQWASLSPVERIRLAEAYRLGALHQRERIRMRYRQRARRRSGQVGRAA